MFSSMLAGQRREEQDRETTSEEKKPANKDVRKHRGLRERLLDYVMKRFNPPQNEEGLGEISSWCGARHRPEPPRVLERQTRFTASEIKLMYRGFKQECPSGVVDEDTFKHIFSQFFPLGDASQYAHYVFNTVKHKTSPNINFEEFLLALSRVARGTTQEKLTWVFNLYDTDGDGRISRQELADIVKAVYLLLGRATSPPCRDQDVLAHADRVFTQMDADADGAVSREELAEWILARPHAAAALHTLDTTLDEIRPSCSSNAETNSADLTFLATKLTLSNEISNTVAHHSKTSSSTELSTVFSKFKPLTIETTSNLDKVSLLSSSLTATNSSSIAKSLDSTVLKSKDVGTPSISSPSTNLPPSIKSPSSIHTVPISCTSVTDSSLSATSSRAVTSSISLSVPVRVTTVTEETRIKKPHMRRRRPSPPKSRS